MEKERLEEASQIAYEELKHATNEDDIRDIMDRIKVLHSMIMDYEKNDLERTKVENEQYKSCTDQELKGEELDKTLKTNVIKVIAEVGGTALVAGSYLWMVHKGFKLEASGEYPTSKIFQELRQRFPKK